VNPVEIIQLAFRTVKTNIVRTVITCFIIGIGIMALVCILTSVDGLKMYLSKSFSSMGANTFKIRNRGLAFNLEGDNTAPKVYRIITFLEATKFKEAFNPQYPVSIQYMANQAGTVKYQEKKTNPNMLILGTDENYLANESYTLVKGRNFTNAELRLGSNVTILGYTVAKKLFGSDYNLDQKVVRIDDIKYKVVRIISS
jgi:putative ABC transport system permease protein